MYRAFKERLETEDYLSHLNIKKFRDVFVRFRLGINELKNNVHNRTETDSGKTCPFCMEVENERHFLVQSPLYSALRERYISSYLQRLPGNAVAYLLDGCDEGKTRNTAMFIFYAFKLRREKIQEISEERARRNSLE